MSSTVKEAGPLPQKQGEIGFTEGQPNADLEAQLTPTTTNIPITPAVAVPITTADPSASPKSRRCMYRIAGLRLTTLSILIVQIFIVSVVIAGWVISVRLLNKSKSATSNVAFGGPALPVFLHIIFAVTLLAQLVFFERTLFQLRAQRYTYLHPGEILPSSHIRGRLPLPVIAFAPWNRPPLPTYAAALAQSGAGTGDVEDHMIAPPPPPAYGHTRGSTLLLAGRMRDSLRSMVSRPESALSYINVVPPEEPGHQPMSYEQFVDSVRTGVATGVEGEEVVRDDDDRERRREQTLARLQSQEQR
ncbi:hypothetical protein APHAL10511_008342 [Amanita phalloides]|nr:hypothetical protein APHAL10511_008342 [Amanita phalloides]